MSHGTYEAVIGDVIKTHFSAEDAKRCAHVVINGLTMAGISGAGSFNGTGWLTGIV
jgi:hypothetical protein